MKKIIVLFSLAALSACAHRPSDYGRWSAQLAPTSWAVNSTWTFAITDKKQEFEKTITVVLTDKKGESCTSGDWRHVEILSQQPPAHPEFLGVPAYELNGRAFILNLTANICDVDNDLRGELTETGISGVYYAGGMFGGENVGKFFAVQVPSMPNKSLQPIAPKDGAPVER